MAAPFLEQEGIGKTYPGVTALSRVSLALAPAEVVGPRGEHERVVGIVDEAPHPLAREAAVRERQGQLLAAHDHAGGIVAVGRVDGLERGGEPGLGQTAHSESPISAVNGPVSS